MAADRVAGLLAGDRQHRHVVEPRVVEAGQRWEAPGPEVAMQTPELAGELGIGGGHERGHFLVPRLDELDLALGAVERAEDAVDAVAGIAEDHAHAPCVQPLNEKVADRLCHGPKLSLTVH